MKQETSSVADSVVNPHGDGRYVPILDGWRGIAIILVLLFHGFLNSDVIGNRALQKLAILSGRTGALGVLIFFCISGYLITIRLLVEFHSKGRVSLRAFYIKRVFRILPPLVAYLLVLVLLSALGIITLRSQDWAATVFLSNYILGSWYTSHFWSLSVEEHFYLFWPFCVVLAGWRRSFWMGIALVVAVGIWRPWELRHVASQARALQHTDMRLDYIMLGCIIAIGSEFYSTVPKVLRGLGSTLGLAALFLLLIVTNLKSSIDLRSVQAVTLALMVCGSAARDAPVPRALLANRPILFIGKVSYSLYVWQQIFLARMNYQALRSLYALPFKWSLAFAFAVLSYRYVERPFIQYGRELLVQGRQRLPLEAKGLST